MTAPASPHESPPGFSLTPEHAQRIADGVPAVERERRARPGLRSRVVVPWYFGDRRYEVVYSAGADVRVDVHIEGRSGRVLEVWTGHQADTLLARGYSPSVGRSLNKPYIWLPLAALFILPFFDPRRPFRLVHLDLLVLLGFGVSQYYFNRGEIDISVPLVYPLLVYLLARLLLAGLRPRVRAQPLVPWVPTLWMGVGLAGLVAFRVVLNLLDSHLIDVGAASVVGAERIEHGEDLYRTSGDDGDLGDTYGPVTYLAYVPFEALFAADGARGLRPRRPRGGDQLRPARDQRAAAAGHDHAGRPGGSQAGTLPRLRMGGLPVHALRAPGQHQRRADRGPPRAHPRGARLATVAGGPPGPCGGRQVRPACPGAAAGLGGGVQAGA